VWLFSSYVIPIVLFFTLYALRAPKHNAFKPSPHLETVMAKNPPGETEPRYEGQGPYGDGYDLPQQMPQQQPLASMAYSEGGQLNPQFAVWALSNDEDLTIIENTLRGLQPERDPKTGVTTWIHKDGINPIMNDQGVFEVTRYLRGFTSKLITLSNIPDQQLIKDLRSNAMDFVTNVFLNYRVYGLSPSKYGWVCTECINFIEMSLFKASKGNMTEFVHPKWQRSEQHVIQEARPQAKSGLFDSFKL